MLAHFNKMNTLLLFYRKMGNTLFLEQDEYIVIVFRKDEKYFISLIARWARSYHFSPKRKKYRFWVFLFIFLYISSLFQTLSKMCEAFDGSAVSTLRATSADSAFSQAAKKHKGKKALSLAAQKNKGNKSKKSKGDQSITFSQAAQKI